MKWAMRHAERCFDEYKFDTQFVAFVHDEWQTDTLKTYAERTGEIMVESIIKAGEHFNLRCPLDGNYKIGNNWAETH